MTTTTDTTDIRTFMAALMEAKLRGTTPPRAGQYTYIEPDVEARAYACATSDYQRGLLDGDEAWSGATLRGKAKRWGASYEGTRIKLVERMRAAGLTVTEVATKHGKRVVLVTAGSLLIDQ